MSRLIFIFILFSYHFSSGQDPVRDIDPTRPTHRNNVERQPLPRDEIPGTLRDTQQDQQRFSSQDLQPELGSSGGALSDTTSIRFVDENGKVIHDPHAYTRERVHQAGQQRRAADTLEQFLHTGDHGVDSTTSKP